MCLVVTFLYLNISVCDVNVVEKVDGCADVPHNLWRLWEETDKHTLSNLEKVQYYPTRSTYKRGIELKSFSSLLPPHTPLKALHFQLCWFNDNLIPVSSMIRDSAAQRSPFHCKHIWESSQSKAFPWQLKKRHALNSCLLSSYEVSLLERNNSIYNVVCLSTLPPSHLFQWRPGLPWPGFCWTALLPPCWTDRRS